MAPTVRSQAMSLKALGEDLQQACGVLRWIVDGALCDRLRSTLERVSAASKQADGQAAKEALRAFLDELEA